MKQKFILLGLRGQQCALFRLYAYPLVIINKEIKYVTFISP
jgi:hypothetical protein